MKSSKPIYYSLFLLSFSFLLKADIPTKTKNAVTGFAKPTTLEYTQFDINNIACWFGNNGEIVSYNVTGNSGLEWPNGSGKYAVFQSGLWLAGKVNGEIRTACVFYTSELAPGKILPDGTPDDYTLSKYRIYTITKGNTTSDDYLNWPIDHGAPVDDAGNPLCLGDQTHWFVCNDANAEKHSYLFSTEPIGVECQYTLFGVDSIAGLQDVMFVRVLLINKGNIKLDSTYVGIWSDPDIGDANDDLAGCDTLWNLGYAYNGETPDDDYGTKIPAVGYQLLQGPLVPSEGDIGLLLGNEIPDFKNLPLTAFLWSG
ncbi:MAG: hypothetical protein KAT54_06290 [Candidatus Marinimicrobia bacterium]|nr:hypothetical protein [Candidatus Neomarinimicrobiota bacterium]